MENHNIITFGGPPGAGKTETIAELLLSAHFEGYEKTSTGEIARGIAQQYPAIPFNQFPDFARKNNIPYDHEIDRKLALLGESEKKLLVDSRLGYHFLPHSYKVLLYADISVIAQRIYNDKDRGDSSHHRDITIEYLIEELESRRESDRKKYIELYSTDYTDQKNYDLVINTGLDGNSISRVVGDVMLNYFKWQKHQPQVALK